MNKNPAKIFKHHLHGLNSWFKETILFIFDTSSSSKIMSKWLVNNLGFKLHINWFNLFPVYPYAINPYFSFLKKKKIIDLTYRILCQHSQLLHWASWSWITNVDIHTSMLHMANKTPAALLSIRRVFKMTHSGRKLKSVVGNSAT